jgi:hypothetical protein
MTNGARKPSGIGSLLYGIKTEGQFNWRASILAAPDGHQFGPVHRAELVVCSDLLTRILAEWMQRVPLKLLWKWQQFTRVP